MRICTTRGRMLSAKLKKEDNSVLIATVIGTDGKEEVKEYPVQEEGGNRYIAFEDDRHDLIERQGQIEKRLGSKNYDFSFCIFLCDANFGGAPPIEGVNLGESSFKEDAWFVSATFIGKATFLYTKFYKAACFRDATFNRVVHFSEAEFRKHADFQGAKFSGLSYFNVTNFIEGAKFMEAVFIEEAIFGNAQFSVNANFSLAKFYGAANFKVAEFSGVANFLCATFSRKTDFRQATFSGDADFVQSSISGSIDFSSAKFDAVFNFQNVEEKEGFSLSLLGVEIENLWYTGSDIPKAENRETFLVLKQHASKQLDNVGALEFYKKEMKQYKEDLQKGEKKASCADRIILWFEWGASRYGTAPFRATLWLVGINAVYIVASIFLFYVPGDIPLVGFISNYSFNPFSILSDLKIDTIQGWRAVLVVLNFLKNILTAVLAYEIIKSFRKYSRRL